MLLATLNDPYENSAAQGGIVNRTLGGRYEILEALGEGPLLAAYRARDRQANRIVTVKTLLPVFVRRNEVAQALRDGVGQSLALNHHAIARVLDLGVDDETGVLYLAEEYVRGVDLKERIRRTAPIQLANATDTALALAEALEAAHARHLAHGDVRPQNILIGPDGQTKLTNFGLASALHKAGDDPGVLKRVVAYTAPDAARQAAPTPSSDLYGLGIVYFEMLTGTVPYAGDNPLQVALRHLQEPVPSARAINSGVPVAVDGILQKLLGKTPLDRYPSAAELLRDLRQVRDALRYGKSLSWSPLDKPTLPVPAAPVEDRTIAPRRAPAAPAPAVPAAAPGPTALGQRASLTVREPETGRTLAYSDPEEESMPVPPRSGGLRWLTALIVLGLVGLALALSFLAINVRNILRPTNELVLPNLVGKPIEAAKKTASDKNFRISIVDEEYRDDTPKGSIFKMGETPGRTIKEGRQIPVWVSRGPRVAVVPDVGGLTFDKARKELEKAGLRLGDVARTFDPLAPEGTVISQKPGVGEDEPRGTRVDLTLSKGEEPTPTPEPIPTPEPYNPGDYGTRVEPTPAPDSDPSTPHYFSLKYSIPSDGLPHKIRVDVSDDNGPRTVHDESHAAGETVNLKEVKSYGGKALVKVYDNDELKSEDTFIPKPK